MTPGEQLLKVLQAHRPMVTLCPFHGYHVRECSCGQDPLDFDEHLVNRLLAAGVCTWSAAADVVLDELNSEETRLTTPEHPKPWAPGLLGNWLGGIQVGVTVLRDRAKACET